MVAFFTGKVVSFVMRKRVPIFGGQPVVSFTNCHLAILASRKTSASGTALKLYTFSVYICKYFVTCFLSYDLL